MTLYDYNQLADRTGLEIFEHPRSVKLFVATVTVGLADIVTTYVGVSMLGIQEENPAAQVALAHLGPAGLLGMKMIFWGSLVWAYEYVSDHEHPNAIDVVDLAQFLTLVFVTLIVLSNLLTIWWHW